ncbi:uncharacterized protein LOC108675592 [Hyalella azteca]|uniref:Uncharacterized protein LOC108675592 n=1 Tax=Hyalella azteca TaxID=294128 RepID=A0A8B7NZA2_HYAAZ|nr:uncharacterized protein LOC108675592 [Hyalella azteca]
MSVGAWPRYVSGRMAPLCQWVLWPPLCQWALGSAVSVSSWPHYVRGRMAPLCQWVPWLRYVSGRMAPLCQWENGPAVSVGAWPHYVSGRMAPLCQWEHGPAVSVGAWLLCQWAHGPAVSEGSWPYCWEHGPTMSVGAMAPLCQWEHGYCVSWSMASLCQWEHGSAVSVGAWLRCVSGRMAPLCQWEQAPLCHDENYRKLLLQLRVQIAHQISDDNPADDALHDEKIDPNANSVPEEPIVGNRPRGLANEPTFTDDSKENFEVATSVPEACETVAANKSVERSEPDAPTVCSALSQSVGNSSVLPSEQAAAAVDIPQLSPASLPPSADIPNKQLKALLCSDVVGRFSSRQKVGESSTYPRFISSEDRNLLLEQRPPNDFPVPPAKRHCTGLSRSNQDDNSRSFYLKAALSSPARPLPSSYSSPFAPPFSSSFCQLSPSATKLPRDTINKQPPLPLCHAFYETHCYPSSSRSLFERLYYAAVEENSPRNVLATSQSQSTNRTDLPSSTSEVSSTTNLAGQRRCSSVSSSRLSVPSRKSSSTASLPLSYSMPSLASLLSSSVNTTQRTDGSREESLSCHGLASEAPKLPNFRHSFAAAAGARRIPSDGGLETNKSNSDTDEDVEKVSSTTGEDEEAEAKKSNARILPVGNSGHLPFVGRVPKFTVNFLRTLKLLLCKHCRRDCQNEAGVVGRCGRCHGKPLYSLFVGYESEENCPPHTQTYPPTSLHVACLLSDPCPYLRQLLTSGYCPNYPNLLGQTPLHSLLMGDVRGSGFLEALTLLLEAGASPQGRDTAGATPLLYLKLLLREGLYGPAAAAAQRLLDAGAEVDAANDQGRTLLSYSLCCGDRSLALTRLLLNHGADIWGNPHHDWDHSAFLYLFKTAMLCRSVAPLTATLSLIGRLMSGQPRRMRLHLQRNVTRHGRCHAVLSGVSTELVRFMEPYYKRPQPLGALAALAIRGALPSTSSVAASVARLPLPHKLQRQLALLE